MNIVCSDVTLNLQHTWSISRESCDFKNNVIIELENDGITACGEAEREFLVLC